MVGLGTNNFGGRMTDVDAVRGVVDTALQEGVNLFDTADIYGGRGGSERLLGQVLSGRRDEVVLATKFGMDMSGAEGVPDVPHGSREYIRWAIDGSLQRLDTDRIDLYQMHQPDPQTPIAETLAALDELAGEGLVREIGCSNFNAEQLAEAQDVAEREGHRPFVSLQNQYSLVARDIESDVLGESERRGVAVLPFFPLASGLLSGKYRRGEAGPAGTRLGGRGEVADAQTFDRLEALAGFTDDRGLEMIDVAIGWLLSRQPIASVIAGATKPEQVRANVRAARWSPSSDDLAAIDEIFPPPR